MLEIHNATSGKPKTTSIGQVEFTTTGTFSWTVPAKVYEISLVGISGGGGTKDGAGYSVSTGYGGGGGLGYCNRVAVKPGDLVTGSIGKFGAYLNASSSGRAGDGGETSVLVNGKVVLRISGGKGGGSNSGGAGGSLLVGEVGYTGGTGGSGVGNGSWGEEGAGGCAGYAGNGGAGASYPAGVKIAARPGAGGSGAGGGMYNPGGGGVGIRGIGSSGVVATGTTGSDATLRNGSVVNGVTVVYGAGGRNDNVASTKGSGAVRIIWGEGRAYPNTLVANM